MSADENATNEWVQLDENQRFSRSVLWTLMKAYYHGMGPKAWLDGDVPNYVTCNTFIAQSYANVVMAYLRELARTGVLVANEPVYIIELASGVGAFAAYFLHKFGELKLESSLSDLDVRYVMTDFTQTNLQATQAHPHLRPFAASGVLKFGKFDIDEDSAIELVGGGSLTAGSLKNPVIILGNYAFDTFRQDIFRLDNGTLNEVCATTRAPGPGPIDLTRTDLLPKLQTQYSDHPIDEARYYDDPIYNELLAEYRTLLADTTFTIPVASLKAIDRLLAFSGGRGLLLSSDKGFTHLDELYHREQQTIQLHGSFSVMVNYHAIGRYFTRRGGVYAATSRKQLNLKTAMCVLGDDNEPFVDTLSAFRRGIDEFGPGDFFNYLGLDRSDKRTLEQILGLMRLSGYDPGVLFNHAATIRELCTDIPEWVVVELRLAIDKTWAQYFASSQNLPFELGRILLALRRPLEAARFNQISIDWFGEMPAAYLNMGICYYYAENPAAAMTCFERAIQLNPGFGLPREWIARIESERARAAPARKIVARPRVDEKPRELEPVRPADVRAPSTEEVAAD
ncbi:MAG TPA: tetratricopeptide repeat protein [Kofleriaceae bacterium]